MPQYLVQDPLIKKTIKTSESLLTKALPLKPQDRFLLIDGLVRRLDEPNKEIDAKWAQGTENRLRAHREAKIYGVPFNDVLGEKP